MLNGHIVATAGTGHTVGFLGIQFPDRVLTDKDLSGFGLDDAGENTIVGKAGTLFHLQSRGGTVGRILRAVMLHVVEFLVEHQRIALLHRKLRFLGDLYLSAGQELVVLVKGIAAIVELIGDITVDRIQKIGGGQLYALDLQSTCAKISAAVQSKLLHTIFIGADHIATLVRTDQTVVNVDLGERGVVIRTAGIHFDATDEACAIVDAQSALDVVAVVLVHGVDHVLVHFLGLGASAPGTNNVQVTDLRTGLTGNHTGALNITEAVQLGTGGHYNRALQIDLTVSAGDVTLRAKTAGTAADRVDHQIAVYGNLRALADRQTCVQIGIGTNTGITGIAGAILIEPLTLTYGAVAGIIVLTGNHKSDAGRDCVLSGRQGAGGCQNHQAAAVFGCGHSILEAIVYGTVHPVSGTGAACGHHRRQLRQHAENQRQHQQPGQCSFVSILSHCKTS